MKSLYNGAGECNTFYLDTLLLSVNNNKTSKRSKIELSALGR